MNYMYVCNDRMRPGCEVKLFWLQRAGRSNKWSLEPNGSDTTEG